MIYIHTDNQAAAAIINITSTNPFVLESMRRVFWLSAIYNFRIRAVYYPKQLNTATDAVSRLHEQNGVKRFDSLLATLLQGECYIIYHPH